MPSGTAGPAPRIPSGGSSNHSGGYSPSGSPIPPRNQRKLAPANNGVIFSGAMSSVKGLNGGWQVWGNGSANPRRTASMGSANSANEPQQPAGDSGYRSPIGDSTWTTPRATSAGSWDVTSSPINPGEGSASPKRKEQAQLEAHSPNHASYLQQARQRQAAAAQASALSAPRLVGITHEDEKRMMDDNDRSVKASFSPKRFDSGGSSASPSKSAVFPSTSPFVGQPTGLPSTPHSAGGAPSYSSLNHSSSRVDDLSLGLRGMAVEDEYSGQATTGSYGSQQLPLAAGLPPQHTFGQPLRAAPALHPQPPRPYASYPQPDYTAYYTSGASGPVYTASPAPNATPSPGGMYPSVSPQAMHALAHPELHRNPSAGVYYEYNGATRPTSSQYFYHQPPQAVMYHQPSHSPMLNHQIPVSSIADKKRELQNLQYSLQQPPMATQQNPLFSSMRHSTPSPHPQAYPGGVDFGGQLPVIMSGGVMAPPTPVYAHSTIAPHALGAYQGMRTGRRHEEATLRSPLLDEFRTNKAKKWELRDILGYVVEFSGDQHGSRFIQQRLESAPSDEKQLVFDEIVPDNALQLIQDVFGNYVVQKLFEHGTQVQKSVLAATMEGHIVNLSLGMYGCRVVQKAIEYILPDQQATFVKELEPHVLKCVKDANGNHVIQKLIERVMPDRLGFVDTFQGNVYELSTHPYGCRVLQRCFEHLAEERTRPLLDELHKYTANLMQDQFGNYVIQFVLEHGQPEDRAMIISRLRGQMLTMSRHKFASNVCEKALIRADPETRRLLIDEIMTPKHDGVTPIVTMMKDQFANYVLQRALSVVEGDQRAELVSKVRPQLVNMRRYSSAYSKHLVSIERLLEKCSPESQAASESLGDSQLVFSSIASSRENQ